MNYQQWLNVKLDEIKASGETPRLLLQCCCAPCSSYVLEYLNSCFSITAYYYNPNISPESEFLHRADELKRLVDILPQENRAQVVIGEYEPEKFNALARGREDLKEGGARCYDCYKLRLEQTARVAQQGGFDYFTTTLSISPHKNAEWLNEIGEKLAKEYGVAYLFSDFKKRNGYKRSCELSALYGLYRQDFCGCEFSRREAQMRRGE